MPTTPASRPLDDQEAPPFFCSWARLYAAILVYVACVITLLALFSRTFTL